MDFWSTFLYGMKAPMIREKYIRRLSKIFDFIGMAMPQWRNAPKRSLKGSIPWRDREDVRCIVLVLDTGKWEKALFLKQKKASPTQAPTT
ncbi:MAG: hypothetical protein ACM3X1_06140 [Ignavibacteriales bacterium]